MSRTNGRPEPEVIVNFSDGFSYAKGKLEDALRATGVLDRPAHQPSKVHRPDPSLKREDVDLIVSEFEISRVQAERVLTENGGDVMKALRALVQPPPTT